MGRITIIQGHPVRETLIGAVGTCGSAQRRKWLDKLAALGRAGE